MREGYIRPPPWERLQSAHCHALSHRGPTSFSGLWKCLTMLFTASPMASWIWAQLGSVKKHFKVNVPSRKRLHFKCKAVCLFQWVVDERENRVKWKIVKLIKSGSRNCRDCSVLFWWIFFFFYCRRCSSDDPSDLTLAVWPQSTERADREERGPLAPLKVTVGFWAPAESERTRRSHVHQLSLANSSLHRSFTRGRGGQSLFKSG